MKTTTKIKRYLKRTFRPIVTAYQRMRYGIADEDIWDLNVYLAEIILRGLKGFKRQKGGHPWSYDLDGVELTKEKWAEYVDAMIFSFKYYSEPWEYNYKTTEEFEKVHFGLKVFAEYYGALWT